MKFRKEDIALAMEDIVVNAANGIGWMGGILSRVHKFYGIAESINYATGGKVEKEIRKHYRIRFPGEVFFTHGYGIGRIGILHAVTMLLPGWWARKETVRRLCPKILEMARQKGAKSIALPYLGCGAGHLKPEAVKRIYEEYFGTVTDLEVIVYYL